jgi:putative transposase
MSAPRPIAWPHAPLHQLAEAGTFFVTAGTYRHELHFQGAQRLEVLHRGLLHVARQYGWQLEAWAVFANHYHFVGHAPGGASSAASLGVMLRLLHAKTATWINELDGTPHRQVWHNFWETRLTYESSYRARLCYTHQNAVKHGLVTVAHDYPWCSAAWFERTASVAQRQTVNNLQTDRIHVHDDYQVAGDW